MAKIPVKMIVAIAANLHANIEQIPDQYFHLVRSAQWRVFKRGTLDECLAVDIVFHEEGKMLRFVTQNKNKRHGPNDYAVKKGEAAAGQLKPYAMQARAGAKITWIISIGEEQKFIGHVYNGQFKPNGEYGSSHAAPTTPTQPPEQEQNIELQSIMPMLLLAVKNLQNKTKEEDDQADFSYYVNMN